MIITPLSLLVVLLFCNNRNKQYILFILLSFISPLNAQVATQNVQKFDMSDGLSSTQLTFCRQDSRGVIWIGTSYGVNSYDGTKITSYTEEEGLPHNYVLIISEDDLGCMWIYTGDFSSRNNFISIIDPIKGQILSMEEYLTKSFPFKSNNIKFHGLCNGSFLLTENNNNLITFYEIKNREISKLFSTRLTNELELNSDVRQNVVASWKNNYGGVSLTMRIPDKQNFASPAIMISMDMEGNVIRKKKLVGGYYLDSYYNNNTVNHIGFNLGADKIYHYKDDRLSHVYSNEEKLGTFNTIGKEYIFSYAPERGKIYLYDVMTNNLEHQFEIDKTIKISTGCIYFDNLNGLWLSSDESIIRIHFSKNKFSKYRKNLGSNFNYPIRGITTTDEGKVLFAGHDGVNTIDKDSVKLVFDVDGFSETGSLGLFKTHEHLFIGTEFKGLLEYSFKTKRVKNYLFENDFSKSIWQPYVDKDNNVWMGAEGLYKLNRTKEVIESVKEESPFYSFDKTLIYNFTPSETGTWLCTSEGLFLVDLKNEEILAHYNSKQTSKYYLPLKNCVHLHIDYNGIFWIATKGQGLVKWNPNTGFYKSYTKAKSGLSHNIIYAVYEDDFGYLWLPSNFGLMRFDKDAENITTYFREDGIPNNEFNTIAHHQDEKGNIYFGTINGMVQFHPKDFSDKKVNDAFLLTNGYRINKKNDKRTRITTEILSTNKIVIKKEQKSVNLEFALINFGKKNGNTYSYKIKGLQDNWSYVSDGKIQLAGLPYGNYKLVVRGKSPGSSTWISYESPIDIYVKKPFYITWWFILLLITCLTYLINTLVKRKTKILKRRQVELEKIVSERTEEISIQAEELKVLDKVKNNFFANISHELRTPLTLILGPLSFILDNPTALEESSIRQQLSVMQRNGKNLLHLIEEILDLSKLEANKLELEKEAINIKEFFEFVFYVFEPQFQSLGINYKLQIEVDGQRNILMDRKKMEKVLNNFLSNSIKFTPRGESILLSIKEKDGILRIKVSDTGKGIHEKDLPHIFDRFYQSKEANHKLHGGTGIGLALVKEFANLMEAEVYAESTLEKGSSFYFNLPMEVVEIRRKSFIEVAEAQEEEIALGNQAFKILVVEDNLDMRTFIYELLNREYTTILTAENGLVALNLIKEHKTEIDLVISDIMMPEMDGLELVKQTKNIPELASIPFIMLTALASERDKLSALTTGIDDYLTKPFSVPELLVRVKNMLANSYLRKEWWASENGSQNAHPKKFKTPSNPVIRLNKHDLKLFEEIQEYIVKNIQEGNLEIEFLAKHFHISVRQLHRKIKSITGMPPARFIKEVQLQKARRMLEDGDYLSIADIAYKVGFEQAATFSTVFKKRFGVSPSNYKNIAYKN